MYRLARLLARLAVKEQGAGDSVVTTPKEEKFHE